MPFDGESGQVYDERIVRAQRSGCAKGECRWIGRCVGIPPVLEEMYPKTRSLQDMLLATILRNLDLLDIQCLATVPSIILEQLWTAIRRSRLDHIRIWTGFATTGVFGSMDRSRLQKAALCRSHGMAVIIKEVNSPALQWLVNLTLQTLECAPVDLLHISTLHNLRNLIIRGDAKASVCLTDSVMREWAFAARDKNALSNLQMIFADHHPDLTAWSIQHLGHFKQLDTFCALACGFERRASYKAKELGWASGSRCATQMAVVMTY